MNDRTDPPITVSQMSASDPPAPRVVSVGVPDRAAHALTGESPRKRESRPAVAAGAATVALGAAWPRRP